MRHRQPVTHQRTQRRMHLFAVPVQQPGSNGRRKLSFVIETDLGQGVRDIVGRVD